MQVTRRKVMALGAVGALFAVVGSASRAAFASAEEVDAAIREFTAGATVGDGQIALTTPEIAENGNTVPITVEVDSPMTEQDHVTSILVLADGNPNATVIMFKFTPASGVAAAKTRIRLAQTQNVIAVAKLSDGSVRMARNPVKVTIGGCGG